MKTTSKSYQLEEAAAVGGLPIEQVVILGMLAKVQAKWEDTTKEILSVTADMEHALSQVKHGVNENLHVVDFVTSKAAKLTVALADRERLATELRSTRASLACVGYTVSLDELF